jgi:hypothetical protein
MTLLMPELIVRQSSRLAVPIELTAFDGMKQATASLD